MYGEEALMGLKEDTMKVGKVGLGVVAGAGGAVALSKLEFLSDDKAGGFMKWIRPAVILLSGAAVYGMGKEKFPVAAPSFAAGWAAVGLGQLIGAGLKAAGQEDIAKYVPFAGVDTYDSGLLAGLGYGGYNASVSRYMMQGSPTQVQQLMGAPLQVQQLAGLGSTVLDGSPTQVQTLSGAPMSATLM